MCHTFAINEQATSKGHLLRETVAVEDKNVYCHEDLQVFDWPNMLTALVSVLDNLNFGWRGLDIFTLFSSNMYSCTSNFGPKDADSKIYIC